ncbi:hypothetical protein ACN2C6_09395 [Caulobacter sp. ErkDOM-YI]|uniref:hypothetical protein n=1 Tax=unclassified Caulobacter TaxID=2648921 RepID=UPI003AF51B5F
MQGHDKPVNQKAFGATLGDLQTLLGPKDGNGLVTGRGERLKGEYPFPNDGTR